MLLLGKIMLLRQAMMPRLYINISFYCMVQVGKFALDVEIRQ